MSDRERRVQMAVDRLTGNLVRVQVDLQEWLLASPEQEEEDSDYSI